MTALTVDDRIRRAVERLRAEGVKPLPLPFKIGERVLHVGLSTPARRRICLVVGYEYLRVPNRQLRACLSCEYMAPVNMLLLAAPGEQITGHR